MKSCYRSRGAAAVVIGWLNHACACCALNGYSFRAVQRGLAVCQSSCQACHSLCWIQHWYLIHFWHRAFIGASHGWKVGSRDHTWCGCRFLYVAPSLFSLLSLVDPTAVAPTLSASISLSLKSRSFFYCWPGSHWTAVRLSSYTLNPTKNDSHVVGEDQMQLVPRFPGSPKLFRTHSMGLIGWLHLCCMDVYKT